MRSVRSGQTITTVLVTLVSICACAAVVIAAQGVLRESSISASKPAPTFSGVVHRGQIVQSLDVEGNLLPDTVQSVALPQLAGESQIVVTNAVAANSSISSGGLLFAANGVPVFAMTGQFPMYRSLEAGESGPDVAELQSALAGLGFKVSDPGGIFGASTAAAIFNFMHQSGWSAQAEDGTPIASVRQAHQIEIQQGQIDFFSELPATLSGDCTAVGQVLQASSCTLQSRAVSVVASEPDEQATALHAGMQIAVTLPDGTSDAGEIVAITEDTSDASTSSSSSSSGSSVSGSSASTSTATATGTSDLKITLKQPPMMSTGSVSATIVLGSSAKNVLIVSAAAIDSSGAHAFHLEKVIGAGKSTRYATIPVRLGMCDDTNCEVTPFHGTLDGARVLLSNSSALSER